MGRKCSVYGCKTGYVSQIGHEKLSVFRFPKDPEQLLRRVRSLPNNLRVEDVKPNMGVCELHFPPDVPKKVVGKYEVSTEPPSIFDNVPQSCRGATSSKLRATKS
ncbi:transposable element p transposase [Plakobranchus ocellatus]|uniref:Transposable element p transposase n=1 Tax=Plakobranchus ocellatus TaxID=259542 RepID=A0AAV4BP42_9GAST|nr:transposable element p transposase [Plakobranchus ocellatus]